MGCMLHSNQAPVPTVQGAFGQGACATPFLSLRFCDMFGLSPQFIFNITSTTISLFYPILFL